MALLDRNGRLLQNDASADGDGDDIRSDGGLKTFSVTATSFGGGTVTLQTAAGVGAPFVDATFEDGTTIAFTANGVATVRVADGHIYRAPLAGSTSPSGVNARLD